MVFNAVIYTYLQKVYIFLTYFIAPPYCLFCLADMQERQALCSTCLMTMLPIVPYDFHIAKNKTLKVYAMSAYKDPLRKLILSKHAGNIVPFKYVAQLMCKQSILQHIDFDVICFIPLHWTRYASRDFNQAEIIAQEIAATTGKTLVPFLIRSKKTQFQARLSVDERINNVKDAFTIDKRYEKQIAGKKILLVDDLFTTGSTMKAAALVLYSHAPAKIDLFVACRVVQ